MNGSICQDNYGTMGYLRFVKTHFVESKIRNPSAGRNYPFIYKSFPSVGSMGWDIGCADWWKANQSQTNPNEISHHFPENKINIKKDKLKSPN